MTEPRRAFITGITGQMGAALAERMLAEGWEVHGLVRRSSCLNTPRIDHLYRDPHESGVRLLLHYGDLCDAGSIRRALAKARPELVFNAAAQSHVMVSFIIPDFTQDVVGAGAQRVLEAVADVCPKARVVQFSSSEMFGTSPAPQDEATPFAPVSPYARAKVFAHHAARGARGELGLDVRCAILFNTEGETRGETFVTRKITLGAARVAAGLQDRLYLGNPDAVRDWQHVSDTVDALLRVAAHPEPGEWVVGRGDEHAVHEIVEVAFGRLGLDWRRHVVYGDSRYLRPAEVPRLRANSRKARFELGWESRIDFMELVARMVDHDVNLAKVQAYSHAIGVVGRGGVW